MKSVILLISTAISCALASKLVSIPFTAVDRMGIRASAYGSTRKKLGHKVEVALQNIDLAYLIDISVGTPPQPFTLLLDTGSSSTWIPIDGCGRYCGYPKNSYIPRGSKTFASNNTVFSIRYGEGFSRGYYARDTVTINGVAVPGVNFAISDYNDGELTEDGADGILGIGPDRLSVYNNPEKKVVPTLVTTMFEDNIIDHNVFSVYFQPVMLDGPGSKEQKRINGEIVFGGVDEKHVASNVTFVPITTKTDFQDYWAVDVQSISVGDHTESYPNSIAAMIDTGSTLVFLPKNVIKHVFQDVKGLRRDFSGQYVVPCQSDSLPSITLTMNNHSFTIAPEHYIITAGALSYSSEFCYTYLQESPPFVDAILGYGFLQQYVSVYDNENKQVGFADRA